MTAAPIAMLLGGFDSPTRSSDIGLGQRPANDVEKLQQQFQATVIDFGWMANSGRLGRLLSQIAKRTGQWSALLAVASWSELRRYEVVYLSGEDVGIPAGLLSRFLPGPRPRFVVRIERSVYGRTRFRRRLHRMAARSAAPRFTMALCRTRGVAQAFQAHSSMPSTAVRALGQEIDTNFFHPAALTDGLPSSVARLGAFVLSAGLEHRDYKTLLKAIDGLPVGLVIAAGSPWSKDTFDASTEDLPDQVVVGSFNPVEMRSLYRSAQVVVLSVHPTERACGMNVIGEAWAMGRPVVATATNGLKEFVTHGQNGILVPPGNANSMRTSIRRILESDELGEQLGRSGRRYVCAHLSLDRFVATVSQATGQKLA